MNWLVPLGLDAVRNLALATSVAAPMAWIVRRRPAAQLRLWRRLLILCLAMPAVSALAPAWHIRVPAAMTPSMPSSVRTSSISAPPAATGGGATARSAQPARRRSGSDVLVWIWTLVAGGLAAELAAGCWGVRRLRNGARPLALCTGVPVFETSALGAPAAIGIWRPALMLPSAWHGWDAEQMAAVLAHEASHLQRNDLLTLRLAELHRTIFWFSPLGWWLPRKLSGVMEAASDEAALHACGIEPERYVGLLLAVRQADAGKPRSRMHAVAMASRRSARVFEKRVQRILNFSKEESMSKKLGWGLGTVGVLASLALVAAVIRPAPKPGAGAHGYQYLLVVHPQSAPGSGQNNCAFTSYDGWTYIAIGDGCAQERGPSEFAVRVSQGAVVFVEQGSERRFTGKAAADAARLFQALDVNNAQQRFLDLQQMQLRPELDQGTARDHASLHLAEQRETALAEQAAMIQERIRATVPSTPEANQRLEQLRAQAARLEVMLHEQSVQSASEGNSAELGALRARQQELQRQLDELKLQASGEVRQLERSLRALASSLGAQSAG
ncbi:MAG TPA: M56 family metallopeptidase [Terriglobales bacterium]|nr:M56 family metallopeptidase [Terriglobales bacterium]